MSLSKTTGNLPSKTHHGCPSHISGSPRSSLSKSCSHIPPHTALSCLQSVLLSPSTPVSSLIYKLVTSHLDAFEWAVASAPVTLFPHLCLVKYFSFKAQPKHSSEHTDLFHRVGDGFFLLHWGSTAFALLFSRRQIVFDCGCVNMPCLLHWLGRTLRQDSILLICLSPVLRRRPGK